MRIDTTSECLSDDLTPHITAERRRKNHAEENKTPQ
jgi:hypothetical protein